MIGDDIGVGHQLVERRGALHAERGGPFLREIRVVDRDLRVERLQEADENAAGHARSDDAHALPVQLASPPGLRAGPCLATLHRAIKRMRGTQRHERRRERPFPDRLRDHVGAVRHDDAPREDRWRRESPDRAGGVADDP